MIPPVVILLLFPDVFVTSRLAPGFNHTFFKAGVEELAIW